MDGMPPGSSKGSGLPQTNSSTNLNLHDANTTLDEVKDENVPSPRRPHTSERVISSSIAPVTMLTPRLAVATSPRNRPEQRSSLIMGDMTLDPNVSRETPASAAGAPPPVPAFIPGQSGSPKAPPTPPFQRVDSGEREHKTPPVSANFAHRNSLLDEDRKDLAATLDQLPDDELGEDDHEH